VADRERRRIAKEKIAARGAARRPAPEHDEECRKAEDFRGGERGEERDAENEGEPGRQNGERERRKENRGQDPGRSERGEKCDPSGGLVRRPEDRAGREEQKSERDGEPGKEKE
jgi:hypothetical protein